MQTKKKKKRKEYPKTVGQLTKELHDLIGVREAEESNTQKIELKMTEQQELSFDGGNAKWYSHFRRQF